VLRRVLPVTFMDSHSSMARRASTATIATPAAPDTAPIIVPVVSQPWQLPLHWRSVKPYPIIAPQAPPISIEAKATQRIQTGGAADVSGESGTELVTL